MLVKSALILPIVAPYSLNLAEPSAFVRSDPDKPDYLDFNGNKKADLICSLFHDTNIKLVEQSSLPSIISPSVIFYKKRASV